MSEARVVFSVSTWRQPTPSRSSPQRTQLIDHLVAAVDAIGNRRVRVAVDGLSAAGKTSLGHELAHGLARDAGRTTLRASLDDFKRPWSEADRYDRVSGEGYYRNAFDEAAARRLLLEPSGTNADGLVALCSIDPLTQTDRSDVKVAMPPNGVLVVDGVFACRPALNDSWDLRVWVEIDAELSVRRGTERDAEMEGSADAAEALHRERYLAAELLYIDEVDPRSFAEVVIDNTDFDRPRLLRAPTSR
jgi:uridine kinase